MNTERWAVEELIDELRTRAEKVGIPVVPEVLAAIEAFEYQDQWEWERILSTIATARTALEQFERSVVRAARLDGETWDAIADALDSNRHTVRYRYGRNDLEPLDRLDSAQDAEMQAALARVRGLQARGAAQPEVQTAVEELFSLTSRHVAERSALERELRDASTAPSS